MYLFERGGDSRGLKGTEISYAGLLSKWLQQPGLDQAVVISLEFSLGLSAERLCHFSYHCYFPGCTLPAGWDGKQSQDWNPRPSNRGCGCLYCHPTCLLQNCLSLKGSCQLSSCDWSFTAVGNSWWEWGVEGYRSTGMIVSVHEEKIFPPLKSRLSYLKGRVIERDREERERSSICWVTLQKATVARARLHLSLPGEWQGSKHLVLFRCFPRCIGRQLDWKWSNLDLNWHLMRYQLCRQRLKPLATTLASGERFWGNNLSWFIISLCSEFSLGEDFCIVIANSRGTTFLSFSF